MEARGGCECSGKSPAGRPPTEGTWVAGAGWEVGLQGQVGPVGPDPASDSGHQASTDVMHSL